MDIWDIVQSLLDSFQVGYLVTSSHDDIFVQVTQGVLIQHQDQMDLHILLSHTCISSMMLKLPGKLLYHVYCLLHLNHAQMQIVFVALEPVMEVFDYLPPGSIVRICPPGPTNLYCPQHTASRQCRRHVWAQGQVSHSMDSCSPKLSGVVWVWDNTQSCTAQKPYLK